MSKFTPEQIQAAKSAKSPEELVKMAKENGFGVSEEQAKMFLSQSVDELSDEELDNVAAGAPMCTYLEPCSNCKSTDVTSHAMGWRRCGSCKSFFHVYNAQYQVYTSPRYCHAEMADSPNFKRPVRMKM